MAEGTQNAENSEKQNDQSGVTTPSGTTTPPAINNSTTNTTDNKSDQKEQVDVAALIRSATEEAVARDREQRKEQAAREAGFESYEQMAKLASEHKAAEDKEKPQIQLLTEQKEALTKECDQLRSQVLDLQTRMELMDLLSKDYKDYIGRQDWILPKLREELANSDKTETARKAALKNVVKSFVNDNPLPSAKKEEGSNEDKADGKEDGDKQRQQGSGPGPKRSGTGSPSPSVKSAQDIGRSYVHNAVRSGLLPRR